MCVLTGSRVRDITSSSCVLRALRMGVRQNSLKTLPVWAYQGKMTCESMVRHQQGEGRAMSTPAKTPWRIAGEEAGGCNCAWGCPCQFNALPTHGRCEGF